MPDEIPTTHAARPSERGLRHGADDDHFAASIMQCRGFAPDCSYHGACVFGWCFSKSWRKIEIAKLKAKIAALEAEDFTHAA